MDPVIKQIQEELIRRGFDPGPADGIVGRLTTGAVAAFQIDQGITIKWPGTIGPKTIAALFGHVPIPRSNAVIRPWFDLAVRKKGLHEGRNYTELATFLKSDGATLGDPRQLPWCGDFVETCIACTLPHEPIPVNPYLARNWLKFGVECVPQLGAVLIFWRGKLNGISGHVAFCAGAGPGVLYCLGGNQSNTVSVTPISQNRLLGARWPTTIPVPDKIILPRMVGGKLSLNEA